MPPGKWRRPNLRLVPKTAEGQAAGHYQTLGDRVDHDLKRQGLTITAIARQVGLERKTVRRYLQRGIEPPAYKPRNPVPRLIASFEDYLRERVAACPELSGKRLLREIRDLGYAGGYASVTEFLRTCGRRGGRSSRGGSRSRPARQAQVDFAEFKVAFDDEPGVVRKG